MKTAVVCFALLGAMILFPKDTSAHAENDGNLANRQAAYGVPGETGGGAVRPSAASTPDRPKRGVGVGVRVSSLGIGGEIAVAVSRHSNVRSGFNAFSYKYNFASDGINFATNLKLQSAEAHYDWYPTGQRIHLSPGVIAYNGNKVTANASVPGGQLLTLDGAPYISDPNNPVTGNASIALNKVAPSLTFGVGNLVRGNGRRVAVNFEIGAAYHGTPQGTFHLAGGVCSPQFGVCQTIASDSEAQANILAEQNKTNHNISPYRFYPLISLGVGYRFR